MYQIYDKNKTFFDYKAVKLTDLFIVIYKAMIFNQHVPSLLIIKPLAKDSTKDTDKIWYLRWVAVSDTLQNLVLENTIKGEIKMGV